MINLFLSSSSIIILIIGWHRQPLFIKRLLTNCCPRQAKLMLLLPKLSSLNRAILMKPRQIVILSCLLLTLPELQKLLAYVSSPPSHLFNLRSVSTNHDSMNSQSHYLEFTPWFHKHLFLSLSIETCLLILSNPCSLSWAPFLVLWLSIMNRFLNPPSSSTPYSHSSLSGPSLAPYDLVLLFLVPPASELPPLSLSFPHLIL